MSEEQYRELKRELLRYRELYEQGQPAIEDYEYDRMMQRLKDIERAHSEWLEPDSPSQTVGSKLGGGKDAVVHDAPMLSIQDVFNLDDVIKFVDKQLKQFPEAEFLVEEKVDGLSAAMRYRNGALERVITRGDGKIGFDKTANALFTLDNLIRTLEGAPAYLELQGEIFIRRRKFDQIYERQLELNPDKITNPRNYAAGLLNKKNPDPDDRERLSFVVHGVMKFDGGFERHSDVYKFLERNGVNVIHDYKLCRTSEEVIRAVEEIGSSRLALDWALDGAVIKIDQFALRDRLGTTAKAPRWAIAYKFPPELKQTIVREIELNVGRTGKITPVAIFDPITLAGTVVTRATLHNKKYIEAKDIRLGSTIEVYKSGEIIPKVQRVVDNPSGSTPYEFIERCPSCGSKLDMGDWCCVNPNCPAQFEERIIYFVGKNAMDIDGFGANTARKLIELGLIESIADIFTLKRDQLTAVGFGPKESENLIAAIEKSKAASPERILTGLGIREVSSTTAQELIAQFGSIDKIINASLDELNKKLSKAESPTVRVVAKNIREFFDVEGNRARVVDADPIKLLCEVPKVGDKTAAELLSKVPALERIADAPIEVLNEWVSKARARESLVVARNVRAFFDLDDNRKLVGRLRAMGLNMGDTVEAKVENAPRGGVIVFTGTLTITRAEAASRATFAGFTVKNSITKSTKYLVVGDKPGSKLAKAESLGITILNEDQFNEMIDANI
ncbi:MAG: NAD-dependent DNA ligase LigA [Selenomonadaceae bacterium]|nr:NAD-dependent DNA ligase LigA [Selenomonadaceae bacterium]